MTPLPDVNTTVILSKYCCAKSLQVWVVGAVDLLLLQYREHLWVIVQTSITLS